VNHPQQNSVYAVVLAAGSATRFGSSKQLAEVDCVTLVQRALNVANAACTNNVLLVVGHDRQAVTEACDPMPGFIIVNDHYSEGLSTSISQAVRSIRHQASAIIILLADQVLVTEEHVRALVDAWSGADDEIVATESNGRCGPPALFSRSCFDDLVALQGDAGGRELLSDERFRVKRIRFEPAAVDIDTPEDLALERSSERY